MIQYDVALCKFFFEIKLSKHKTKFFLSFLRQLIYCKLWIQTFFSDEWKIFIAVYIQVMRGKLASFSAQCVLKIFFLFRKNVTYFVFSTTSDEKARFFCRCCTRCFHFFFDGSRRICCFLTRLRWTRKTTCLLYQIFNIQSWFSRYSPVSLSYPQQRIRKQLFFEFYCFIQLCYSIVSI